MIPTVLEKNITAMLKDYPFLNRDPEYMGFYNYCIQDFIRRPEINGLLELFMYHSKELFSHCVKTSVVAGYISFSMDLPKNFVQDIILAGLCHDTGKLFIPQEILFKRDKLTHEEWSVIRRHPELGSQVATILIDSTLVSDTCHYHHVNYNMKGYPEIDVKPAEWQAIQIVSLADAFDAMISRRSYRQAMPVDLIIKEIYDNLGSQFNPEIGSLFLDIVIGIKTTYWKDDAVC